MSNKKIVIRVDGYKSNSGKIFETREEAIGDNMRNDILSLLRKSTDNYSLSFPTTTGLVNTLLRNRKKVVEILSDD